MKKAGRKAHHYHLHKNPKALVLSIGGAVLALFVFSWIYGSNYTGYVNVDINTVHLDERAYEGTRLIITSEDGQTIPMGAARISGKIYGEGDVSVYLVSNERRFLVYSNNDKPERFSLASEPRGNIARSVSLDSSSFSFANGPESALRLGVIEGTIQYGISEELPLYVRSACRETCRLHGSADSSMYVFVFEMDPGTEFEVTDIGFS
jgi:hypothetical protein